MSEEPVRYGEEADEYNDDQEYEECPECGDIYTGMTCECCWKCIGEGCINPHYIHMRDECFTVDECDEGVSND